MNGPEDREFNRSVILEITVGTLVLAVERVAFFDMKDRLREVIYASEFHRGDHLETRQKLTATGDLKGIVYDGFETEPVGPRHIMIEYLPTGEIYELSYQPSVPKWIRPPERDKKAFQKLWEE